MSYLEPVAREYRRLKLKTRRAARKSAERAARFVAENPGKVAAAGVLAGALAARAVSSHRAASDRAVASERMSEEMRVFDSQNAVRVFVELDRSAQAERDGMKNALRCATIPLGSSSGIEVKFDTAVVVARKCEDPLIKKAIKSGAPRVVIVHFGDACTLGVPGLRYHANLNGAAITAHVFAHESETVLVDADDAFFACTLIRDPSRIVPHATIVAADFFAGIGGRIRADSMYACHHKVRSLRGERDDAGSFHRVFVARPRGGWLVLAELLESHGLAAVGSRLDLPEVRKSAVWGVKWNPNAKKTLLVVVSPAYGCPDHKEAFLVHCMLHNLRKGAMDSGSDVRFTIGVDDARLLANEDVSPNGPRWTKTCDVFAPFYESSPYVVLAVRRVAIHGALTRALGEVQKKLDGSIAELKRLAATEAGGYLEGLDSDLVAVFPTGEGLRVESGTESYDAGDVVLILKNETKNEALEPWERLEKFADHRVYVPKIETGFGAGVRSRSSAKPGAPRRKKWV